VKKILLVFLVVCADGRAGAAALPGFRVEKVGGLVPFASSIAFDSKGTLYYTTTSGKVIRGDGRVVATVETEPGGNSGLLGMALESDHTAIVHYTTPNQVADVIARIDLDTGQETKIHEFVADIELPIRGSNSEHHGGNPIVTGDGDIFVAIGDYGSFAIAAKPEWNAGKVFRIAKDGTVGQFARGFRNPYDMAWDAEKKRLFIPDNGDANDDEINVIGEGAFCGWPQTMGNGPDVDGGVRPAYVWPAIVAPTGVIAPTNRWMSGGYLVGAFVSKAIYFVRDADNPQPVALIEKETGSIVDLAEGADGDIYFTTGLALYRLVMPSKGDCNGDGLINAADLGALDSELADGTKKATETKQSWGCDADGDGLISSADRNTLMRLVAGRVRAIR
jgi:glucose/arabinose dehydrogenase